MRWLILFFELSLLSSLLASVCAAANSQTPEDIAKREQEKEHFTLFNPTPQDLLRDFNPDRPSQTNNPYTVDAGHVQIETSLASYTRSRNAGVLSQTWNFNPMWTKLGLTNRLDAEVITETYNRSSRTDGSPSVDGYGNTDVGAKYNFFGNEGGPVAFGTQGFVKIPTAADGLGNEKVEGTALFLFSFTLPANWSSGMMMEISKAKNINNDSYHTEFISSWVLTRALPLGLSGYIEFYSDTSNEQGSGWQATADTGLIYSLAQSAELDVNADVGVTPAAPDYNVFFGGSIRF
jgi:hypothetical protein